MTLRISQVGSDPAASFKIDGRLTAEEVPELLRVCVGITGPVVLDLTDLQFADRQGVSALRELRAHGARFTGASPYIELLIGEAPLNAAN
jgi:anti-anti-sigma regulatory factor